MQNQKEGVVAWASRDLDPTKTLQIRWCRRVGGEQAAGGARLLHEEALARRGVRLAGRRLFLDLAQAEFKYFGCGTNRTRSESVGWEQLLAGD